MLPPGASIEPADDLPEYPRLRPLVIMPIVDQEREMLVVSDPLGMIPGQPVLGMGTIAMLQMLDGSASVTDITAAIMRESKDLRVGNMVREFVRQLDEMLMLDSPRFDRPTRSCGTLPPARDALRRARGPRLPGEARGAEGLPRREVPPGRGAARGGEERLAPPDAVPRAVLAPHLDPRREGHHRPRLPRDGRRAEEPLRVVVFGTGHTMMGDRFALTRKHFETPFGRCECDTEFVDTLAAELGDHAYRRELVHRDEHSIEFQVLYLQRRLPGRPVKLVPILCGGFHDLLDDGRTPRHDEVIEKFLAALRAAERWHGGATVYVAAMDLSHVGPRFDPREGKLDDRHTGRSRRRTAPPSRRPRGATLTAGSPPSRSTTTHAHLRLRPHLLAAARRRIVEHLFQDGEWVVLEWRDPGGLRGCGFFHVENGKISFQRGYWDKSSFLRQHGLPFPTE